MNAVKGADERLWLPGGFRIEELMDGVAHLVGDHLNVFVLPGADHLGMDFEDTQRVLERDTARADGNIRLLPAAIRTLALPWIEAL